ncbi:MAG: NHL repeat-containing protein [Acidobacteriota bacterium]
MKKVSVFICFFLMFFYFGFSGKEEWKGKIEYEKGVKVIKNYGKGLWEESKKGKKIFFKEELSIGVLEGDENKIFHQPMDVIADERGNIYVLDSGNNRIQKFDKNGNYLLTIGKKGQGPGEILNSQDIEFDSKGNILVFDKGNNRITKFDSQGKLIDSFNLKFQPSFGVLDSDDNIYVYERYNGKLIHKFNSQGEHLFSFLDEIKIEQKRIEPHLNYLGRIVTTEDDKIFLVLIYPYTIYVHDKEGKLLEKIITEVPYAQPPYITPPTSFQPNVVITNFVISGVDISPQGYIFCRVISFEIPDKLDSFEKVQELMRSLFKEYSYIDLFDQKGRFLTHQKTEGFSWGSYFDKKGYYYGIEETEDYFRAVKYSVQFK